jgi:hypothetical protein
MLLDFHLAREPIRPNEPAPDWLGGTPEYMPPEQQVAMGEGRERKTRPPIIAPAAGAVQAKEDWSCHHHRPAAGLARPGQKAIITPAAGAVQGKVGCTASDWLLQPVLSAFEK